MPTNIDDQCTVSQFHTLFGSVNWFIVDQRFTANGWIYIAAKILG